MLPWTVIVVRFSAVLQIARTYLVRRAENESAEAIYSASHLNEILG